MASAFPHACNRPGCGELTRERFCPQHAGAADYHRHAAAVRGYDRRWRKVRLIVLERDAWRCYCDGQAEGCNGWATEVHHVLPLRQGGPRLDPANCIATAHACHAIAEAMAARGEVHPLIARRLAELGL